MPSNNNEEAYCLQIILFKSTSFHAKLIVSLLSTSQIGLSQQQFHNNSNSNHTILNVCFSTTAPQQFSISPYYWVGSEVD